VGIKGSQKNNCHELPQKKGGVKLHKEYQHGKQTKILQVTEIPLKNASLNSIVIRNNEFCFFSFPFFFFGWEGVVVL
jgi:hypothetical protein